MTQHDETLPPSAAGRPRRRWWWRAGLITLLLLLLWLVASVVIAGWHAMKANDAMSAITAAVSSGDPTNAASSIESAQSNTKAARSAATSLPIAALKVVPYFRTNLTGADAFMGAVLEVLDAADATLEVYPEIAGTGPAGESVFKDGRVDVKTLESTGPTVSAASENLDRAVDYLAQVPADASPRLRALVDRASPDIERLAKGLRIYNQVLPELPVLLGERKPATYLVVFHNPGELYAGGGAALNMALLQFDKGKMKVIDRGDVAHFFPGAQRVPWDPVAQGPYYAERGARDGFAWSNLHQDYRVAGEDIMRSWMANGGRPVDGVISLDPVALQAAVAVTGPIESTLYGKITADNLVEKLLYEGYKDGYAQQRRHEVNQELIDEMLARIEQGDATLTVARAILATAPGQHIRIHLTDDRLAEALAEAELDGAQPTPQPDRIAIFTQNQNSSKVDIFQTRRIIHDVTLASDGSASVIQTAKVTNATPTKGASPSDARTSYGTRWAFHWNIVLLPEGAQDVKLAANPGDVRVDRHVFTDVDGRESVRVGRWIPPGESTYVTVSYRLPPGTFGQDADLEYRAGVEYQLMLANTDLTVNVRGPSRPSALEGSWTIHDSGATTRFPVTQPTVLALSFPPE